MIYYPLNKLKGAGITDIMIITGKEHMGNVVNLLGSGFDMGLELSYRIQDQPGGIAQALGLCEDFVGDDLCCVILGDNIFQDDLNLYSDNFTKQKNGAKIILKEVPDPQRYGVVEFNGKLVASIEEKPQNPKSNFCVTGIYFYDSRVFNIIKTLKPSGRGELEITDVNNHYVKIGEMTYDMFDGWWTDAGTFPSLATASELAYDMDLSNLL